MNNQSSNMNNNNKRKRIEMADDDDDVEDVTTIESSTTTRPLASSSTTTTESNNTHMILKVLELRQKMVARVLQYQAQVITILQNENSRQHRTEVQQTMNLMNQQIQQLVQHQNQAFQQFLQNVNQQQQQQANLLAQHGYNHTVTNQFTTTIQSLFSYANGNNLLSQDVYRNIEDQQALRMKQENGQMEQLMNQTIESFKVIEKQMNEKFNRLEEDQTQVLEQMINQHFTLLRRAFGSA
jgi:hypothetical protein